MNIVMFILTITFDWLLDYFEKMSVGLDFFLKVVIYLVYSAFSNSVVVGFDCCYVAEGLVTSQELNIKQ